MKHSKSALTLICLVTITALLLAACGQAQPTPTEEAPPATEAPAPAVTEAPPAEPIQLTFWNYWDGTNGEVIQALVDEYNEAHPEVVITNTFIGWGELLPKLQTASAGGEQPDIAAIDLVWMPQLTSTGALVELTPYVEAAGLDMTDFYPYILNIDRVGETYYGLPVSTNNLELFYNRDLFTAAGLDPDTPPTTWEELQTMASQCGDPAQGISGMELYTEPGEGLTWQFQVYLWEAGGEFLTPDLSAAAFNSEAGARALQFWVDLIDSGAAPLASWGLFGQGMACMVMDGSWMVGIWADSATFDWATAPVPYPSDGQRATNMGGEHLILFQTDEARQQAAFDFITWLTGTQTQIRWDQETGFMPVRASVASDPGYVSWMQDTEPRLQAFVESQQYAHNRPMIANYAEVSDAFSRELERALLGEVTVAEALASAEAAVNDLLGQ